MTKQYQDELPAWSARRAWACVIAILFVQFVAGIPLIRPDISPAIYFWTGLIQLIAGFAITILFSRCWDFRDFVTYFRLEQRPDVIGWLGTVGGLLFGFAILYGGATGWFTTRQITPGYISGSLQRHQYLYYMMILGQISPFVEELFMRGFLYVAFRRSYGIITATVLVVLFHNLLHEYVVTRSWYVFVIMTGMTVMLCYIRERTDNLWPCILSHWAYNAAVDNRLRLVAIIAVILLFPFIRSREIAE